MTTGTNQLKADHILGSLLDELRELLVRPIMTVRQLLTAGTSYEAICEEFALIFDAEGTGTPELARSFHTAESLCEQVEARLFSLEQEEDMKQQALARYHRITKQTASDTQLTTFAANIEYGPRTGDLGIMLMRQHLVIGDLEPRGIIRAPESIATWIQTKKYGKLEMVEGVSATFETIAKKHTRETLETALSLWDPNYTQGAFKTFESALRAALRL